MLIRIRSDLPDSNLSVTIATLTAMSRSPPKIGVFLHAFSFHDEFGVSNTVMSGFMLIVAGRLVFDDVQMI